MRRTTIIQRTGGTAASSIVVQDPAIALRRFRSIPRSTARKIAWVGDSTTLSLFTMSVGGFPFILGNGVTEWSYKKLSKPGMPFYNIAHGNFGSSGQTALNFINNNVPGANLSDIVAYAPDLIVFSYGINDVRLGLTSKDQLKTYITQAINNIRSSIPNADIILRMPNYNLL